MHRNSIRHKDLKPANILLLDEGGEKDNPNVMVIIADLGISKASTTGCPTTFDGTKQYMAPEQLAGESSTTTLRHFLTWCLLCADTGSVLHESRQETMDDCETEPARLLCC